jgi:hypothetical protein
MVNLLRVAAALALIAPLGGCGAFVAGAAGGLAAGAVIEHSHEGPPPPIPLDYQRRY